MVNGNPLGLKLRRNKMELDKRIEDIKDIKTIITADENDVGKMGYFANSVDYFKDLKKLNGLKYGKLLFFFIF